MDLVNAQTRYSPRALKDLSPVYETTSRQLLALSCRANEIHPHWAVAGHRWDGTNRRDTGLSLVAFRSCAKYGRLRRGYWHRAA